MCLKLELNHTHVEKPTVNTFTLLNILAPFVSVTVGFMTSLSVTYTAAIMSASKRGGGVNVSFGVHSC